jgi:hypothetical protein
MTDHEALTRAAALALDTGRAALAAALQGLRARLHKPAVPVVQFAWVGANTFLVDGRPLSAKGKGLVLAFLVLACLQHGIELPPVATVFPGRNPSGSATQALDRAADQVRPMSAALAKAISSIGTRRGHFVLRESPPVRVVCDAPVLRRFVNPT